MYPRRLEPDLGQWAEKSSPNLSLLDPVETKVASVGQSKPEVRPMERRQQGSQATRVWSWPSAANLSWVRSDVLRLPGMRRGNYVAWGTLTPAR